VFELGGCTLRKDSAMGYGGAWVLRLCNDWHFLNKLGLVGSGCLLLLRAISRFRLWLGGFGRYMVCRVFLCTCIFFHKYFTAAYYSHVRCIS